jgi:methylthioribose-1-phosphate isomerase
MPDEPIPADPARRRFFRAFAGDVATSVGSMIGVAQTLQAESANAAREILGVVDPVVAQQPAPRARGPFDASTAGYRAPFRLDDDVIYLVDQRQLPDVLQEIEVRGAADAITAINDGAIYGSAVHAQLAAATLALVAAGAVASRPFARRATIRGAANAFRLTRPGSAALALAVDRILALLDELGIEAEATDVTAAIAAEADAIIAEATEDHGRIALLAPTVLPGEPDAPLHVLVAGSTGAMGSGQFGTALGAVMAIHHAGRPVHALVAETRPAMIGGRLAAWELRQAGVPYAVTTDAAAPGCIASREVDAVLVTADRVAANGDVIATVGTYPLALAASAAGIPFLVCVSTSAVDPAAADGAAATIEEGRPTQVLSVHGRRIAPLGTDVRNPVSELVPASLVTALVTDEGVLRAPFEGAIAAAVASASVRRSAARGFSALTASRAAEAAAARAASAEAAPAAESSAAAESPAAGAAEAWS